MKGTVHLDREYHRAYEDIFRDVLARAETGRYDECTLPSYAHRNRLISWFFWKRVETALEMAGNLRGKKVLDFGCGGGVTFRYLSGEGAVIVGCESQFAEITREVSRRLGMSADVYQDIRDIRGLIFDCIFALDVLEHLDDLDAFIDRFLGLSCAGTKIILSGPTENILYRAGRALIGYSAQGRFHERNIYDVEQRFMEKGLKMKDMKNLFTLFRVSSWSMDSEEPAND